MKRTPLVGWGAWLIRMMYVVCLWQAGACAIFGPGTRITAAALKVLDKIKEKKGYK